MGEETICFVLNGTPVCVDVGPGEILVDVIRDRLNLTGTKVACREGECGACTVLLDGDPVNACLVLARQASGRTVRTIEGLTGPDGQLDPVQEAFVETGAIQCGFCTPGMVMTARALLDRDPNPGRDEIRAALSGNICRCTGYVKILEAVGRAADGKNKPRRNEDGNE